MEIKKLTLDERAEICDIGIRDVETQPFSMWVKIIRIGTALTDDEINDMSNTEIIKLGQKIVDSTNMSKKKK